MIIDKFSNEFNKGLELLALKNNFSVKLYNNLKKATSPSFNHNISISNGTYRIIIYDIKDLNKCRRWLSNNLELRNFRYQIRWYGGSNELMTSWVSDDNLFEIWLSSDIGNYPKELSNEGCKWEKVEKENSSSIEFTYKYVCNIKKDS